MSNQRFEFMYANDLGDEYPAFERLEADGEYVRYEDHLSQLAALREELAKYKGGCVDLSSQVRELEHKMDYWKDEGKRADEAQQRLADAERRNAELVELLRNSRSSVKNWRHELVSALPNIEQGKAEATSECSRLAGLLDLIDAALNKPDVSLISEDDKPEEANLRKEDDEALQRRHDQERADYFNSIDEEAKS